MPRYEDLTGKIFNRLTVLRKDVDRVNKLKSEGKYRTYWICECSCGNIKSVDGYLLKKGKTKSCGCFNSEIASKRMFVDLTGKVFGRLKVLKLDEERNNLPENREKYKNFYICQCECGNIKSIFGGNLTSKTRPTLSCGCLQKEVTSNSYKDLRGMKFGMLTPIEREFLEEKDEYYWKCKCDCGNVTYVPIANLREGGTKSCGCIMQNHKYRIRNNLVGNRYGRLLVCELDVDKHNEVKVKKNANRTYYKCKCDCGNYTSVGQSSLVSGQTTSCGCYALELLSGENSHLWKGGTTALHDYLRHTIKKWKNDSLEACEYRCIISGSNNDLVVHHIYPFSEILKETLEELDIEVKFNISEYSPKELASIEERFLKKHYEYGFGAVITSELHMEFHNIYGRGNYGGKQPTENDWYEFLNNKLKQVC